MHGWRRLGIVLSVLWFVGFGGWFWVTEADSIWKTYSDSLWLCRHDLKGEPLSKADPKADKQDLEVCENIAAGYRSEQMKTLAWVLILIDLGLIAFSWLLAWIIISVSRWVRAGFRPQV